MIAELFYPKEIKQVIADLRAKGDLNEGALVAINKQLLWPLLVLSLMILAILVMEYPLYSFSVSLVLFVIMCFAVIRGVAKSWVLPFTLGEKVTAHIKQVRLKKHSTESPREWFVICDFKNLEGLQVVKKFRVPEFENAFGTTPKAGDEINVFLHPANHKVSALGATKRFKNYCLSKSRIKSVLDQEKRNE